MVGAIVYNHITRAFEARLIETHSTIEVFCPLARYSVLLACLLGNSWRQQECVRQPRPVYPRASCRRLLLERVYSRCKNALALETPVNRQCSVSVCCRGPYRIPHLNCFRFIITVGMRLAGVFNRPSFVYAYTRFYLWLFPNVVPNWKPAPQHRLLAVNMRSWNVASVRFEVGSHVHQIKTLAKVLAS